MSSIIVSMKQLSTPARVQVVSALVEGCSIRSTSRMFGVSRNTVTKLLVDLGYACSNYQNRVMVNLPCKRLQVDEIWSFVGCKEKHVPEAEKGELGRGDIWTWTALCADTKIVPSWIVGHRDGEYAGAFMLDLSSRLANRVQMTSDGLKCYLTAVADAFGDNIDFAQLIKQYGNATPEGQQRYSPAECIGCEKKKKIGDPDPDYISTSYAERQNLTMRMRMRRFTRLTNAFSKKLENHEHAIALYFMHYNFVRVHQTLKTTPAVAAGVAKEVWSLEDLIDLLNASIMKRD